MIIHKVNITIKKIGNKEENEKIKSEKRRNKIKLLLCKKPVNRINNIKDKNNPWNLLGIAKNYCDDLSNICSDYTINFDRLKLALNSLANAVIGHE